MWYNSIIALFDNLCFVEDRSYCHTHTHRVKVLELLAESEPLERRGWVEGMKALLEGSTTHLGHLGPQ